MPATTPRRIVVLQCRDERKMPLHHANMPAARHEIRRRAAAPERAASTAAILIRRTISGPDAAPKLCPRDGRHAGNGIQRAAIPLPVMPNPMRSAAFLCGKRQPPTARECGQKRPEADCTPARAFRGTSQPHDAHSTSVFSRKNARGGRLWCERPGGAIIPYLLSPRSLTASSMPPHKYI